jgi:hypothetical protein
MGKHYEFGPTVTKIEYVCITSLFSFKKLKFTNNVLFPLPLIGCGIYGFGGNMYLISMGF